jgi:hypothetical protein
LSYVGALRIFSFWIANGTVGLSLLEGIGLFLYIEKPSGLEQAYAICANVIEMDD